MKKVKVVICTILIIIAVLSLMAFPASASNYQNTTISNIRLSHFNWTDPIMPRAKTDSTPVYFCLTNIGYSLVGLAVQAMGTNAYLPEAKFSTNLTFSNGAIVDNVFAFCDKEYSIHTLIYEEGFTNATLRFKTGITTGDTLYEAIWSPDSIGTYNEPD